MGHVFGQKNHDGPGNDLLFHFIAHMKVYSIFKTAEKVRQSFAREDQILIRNMGMRFFFGMTGFAENLPAYVAAGPGNLHVTSEIDTVFESDMNNHEIKFHSILMALKLHVNRLTKPWA